MAGLVSLALLTWFIRTRLGPVLQRELPPIARNLLREYNITPATGQQIATILNTLDRTGII